MKTQNLNKKQQTEAFDFSKINDALSNSSSEKLDKIDDYFQNNAQVAKTILPNQPPFHEPAKPAPQQQMVQNKLWSEA